jgi:hypothetical protein
MAEVFELIPREDLRVIDLVEQAGIDVTDWSNFKGKNPATNPKYCYEWAFPSKDRVVLNLWYDEVIKRDGKWAQDLRPREWGRSLDGRPLRTNWIVRAHKFEEAIRAAYQNQLPLNVILCAGTRRKIGDADASASRVKKRILDPVAWTVTSYNPITGACILTRGSEPDPFTDQFELQAPSPERHSVTSNPFKRDEDVRRRVRQRAKGRCEHCGVDGMMENGKIYVETHHVIPLSEGGADADTNVVALCPNHHRQAHFASNNSEIRQSLLRFLSELKSAK